MKNEPTIVFQAENGAIELRQDAQNETIWANQKQISEIFGVNTQAITKHLKNIFEEGELMPEATCSILEQVQKEGKRKIKLMRFKQKTIRPLKLRLKFLCKFQRKNRT